MNLACTKKKERNPFTRRCVLKCRPGTERIKDNKKKKFVCLKMCKKGSVRNMNTMRCRRSKKYQARSKSPSNSSYFTALESPQTLSESQYYTPLTSTKPSLRSTSLEYLYENSPKYSGSNEIRLRNPASKSLEYYNDNGSTFSDSNKMRHYSRSPSTHSASLEYFYDNSPDIANLNEMRKRTISSHSPSLDYFYDNSPDIANLNQMRRRTPLSHSPSLEYYYDNSPDIANLNQMRKTY